VPLEKKAKYHSQNAGNYKCPLPPCKKFGNSIILWFLDKQWIFIILFGIFFFLLGIRGYTVFTARSASGTAQLTDVIYSSFQLFLFTADNVSKPPLSLEIARFGAPLLATYTVIIIILSLFKKQIQSFLIRFSKIRKVVICGLGYLGPAYVRDFQWRGYHTIIIEKDVSNSVFQSSILLGTYHITGDATDPVILQSAHMNDHDLLIAVTGDDTTNIQVGMAVRGMFLDNGMTREDASDNRISSINYPRCILHIEDRWLGNALSERFSSHTHEGIRFTHFNMYHRAATELCLYIWSDVLIPDMVRDPSKNPHLLLIGYGTMGEEFVKQLIRRWNEDQSDLNLHNRTLVFSILDYKDSEDKTARLRIWMKEKRYPPEKIDIRSFSMKIPSSEFLEGEWMKSENSSRITASVICLSNPTLAISSALELSHLFQNQIHEEKRSSPIYVRLIRADGVEQFIDLLNNKKQYANLKPYTVVEYGLYWDEELEKQFPERKCPVKRFCPVKCPKN